MADAAVAPPRGEPDDAPAAWRDLNVTARDGLVLHTRDYGSPGGPHLPVVCLPGLTRNARDFHDLAVFLSTHKHRPRRVLAIDFRGRGGSGWDKDWRNYAPLTELGDVLDVLVAARIERACFVGTSRGGIVTMLMSAVRPTAIGAAVLNDVGPEIDGRGLLRIKNVLSATGAPSSWAEAAALLRQAYEAHFPAIDEAGWEDYARKTFDDRAGRPHRAFDPKIVKTLQSIDYNEPMQTLWPQFDGLANVPVLVLRGANSDILSAETLERMIARRPDLDIMVIDNAGHAPMLVDPAELARIAAFAAAADDRKV